MSFVPTSQTQTLARLLEHLAAQHAGRVACYFAGNAFSFADLETRANRVAHALLRQGPGARAAVLGHDHPDSLAILFGAAKARVPLCFVNYRLTAGEVRFILDDFASTLVFAEASQARKLRELRAGGSLPEIPCVSYGGVPAVGPSLDRWSSAASTSRPDTCPTAEDPAIVLYTSGTTGKPKGVQLAQRSFLAIQRELGDDLADWWNLGPDETALHTLPLFHIGGLWWAVNALAAGAKLVMTQHFDPDTALELIQAHQVTIACLVPAMLDMTLERQLASPRKVSSLRTIVYGGAPIAPALLTRANELLATEFVQFYGLTETGNTAVCLRPRDHDGSATRVTAAGLPYPGVRVKVVDGEGQPLGPGEVGEIVVHSPANMLGYWQRTRETEETLVDGWLRTGDAGYLDTEGYLHICDRIKDMIISAGENIYPAEIEAALLEHPSIREVAVIGVPDERWGETVKAVVAAEQPLDVVSLNRFLRGRLAEFKYPRSLDLVDELPRTPSGKIKKHELRSKYWVGRSRKVN